MFLSSIDANVLKFTDQLVLRHFKTSIPILNGDYTKQQYQAYFETCVEPLLKILTENLNKVIYHNKGVHNMEIKFNSSALKLMSTSDLIETCNLLLNTGCIRRNEIREAFGYQLLTDEDGGNELIMSLNFINSKDASDYQKARAGTGDKTPQQIEKDKQLDKNKKAKEVKNEK